MFSLAGFFKNTSGNVAITTALVAVPLLLIGGGAVEYSTLYRSKSIVQATTDAAALAVARNGGSDRNVLEQIARDFVDTHLAAHPEIEVDGFAFNIDQKGDTFEYNIAVEYIQPNSFLRLAEIDFFEATVNSSATASAFSLDVVLVLDSTGSMGNNNKMPELINAVNNFADELDVVDNARVAIVPFDTQVSLENVAFDNNSLSDEPNPLGSTADCSVLSDPTALSLCEATVSACASQPDGTITAVNYTVTSPSITYNTSTVVTCGQLTMTSKDNSMISANSDLLGVSESDWTGCVVDRKSPFDTRADSPDNSNPDTLYPVAYCATTSLQPILPLTEDMDSVKTHANGLTPSGNTNLTIGIQWGMETLTPERPFDETSSSTSSSNSRKIMVVLTDGVNTQNRVTTVSAEIDDRSRLACDTARTLVDDLYTIRVIDGNKDLLRQCATSSEHFFDISDASQLDAVFAEIANQLLPIRLTN